MLTKRQQVVLGKLSKTFAYVGKLSRAWLFFDTEDVPIDAAPDVTSAATLYRLIDAELAALGIDSDGDAVVETTERGDELVELLTTSLTKRQQQVLRRFLHAEQGTMCFDFRGVWWLPTSDAFSGKPEYGACVCSFRTMNILCDAELIGYFLDEANFINAALTPRGRRLAELLP